MPQVPEICHHCLRDRPTNTQVLFLTPSGDYPGGWKTMGLVPSCEAQRVASSMLCQMLNLSWAHTHLTRHVKHLASTSGIHLGLRAWPCSLRLGSEAASAAPRGLSASEKNGSTSPFSLAASVLSSSAVCLLSLAFFGVFFLLH